MENPRQSSSRPDPWRTSPFLVHLRDLGIVWTLSFLSGLMVRLIYPYVPGTAIAWYGASNTVAVTLAFTIISVLSAKAGKNRLVHSSQVAVLSWILSPAYLFFMPGVTVGLWIMSGILGLIMSLVGSLLSFAFIKDRRRRPTYWQEK